MKFYCSLHNYIVLICLVGIQGCKSTQTVSSLPHYSGPVLESPTQQTVDERPCLPATEKVDGYLWKHVSNTTMRPNPVTGLWESTYKMYFDYDSLGNKILHESYSRNQSTGKWEGKYRQVYSYNEKGLASEMINHKGQGSQWEITDKEIYEYDDDGNRILELSYKYENGAWPLLSRTETYREGSLITINSFLVVDGQLREETRYVSYLDHHGKDSVQIKYKKDERGKWAEAIRFFFEFDGDKLLKRTQLRPESTGNNWYIADEQWRKYDSLDRLVQSYFMSDYGNSGFQLKHYTMGFFDDSNGTLISVRFNWDYHLKDWYLKSKNEVIFDCNVKEANIMLPFSSESGSNDLKKELSVTYERSADPDQWTPVSVQISNYLKPDETVVINPEID